MALPAGANGCRLVKSGLPELTALASLSSSLLLLLAVAEQLYAINSAAVVEVIPRVVLRPLSGSPAHRPGVFNFRGRVVPVLDVSQLIAGCACAAHLSSRIIMVRSGAEGLVGLLAERVTDTVLKPLDAFQAAEGAAAAQPWLGGVALDERGLIQLLQVDELTRLALADGNGSERGDD